jgi:hypothetical protein
MSISIQFIFQARLLSSPVNLIGATRGVESREVSVDKTAGTLILITNDWQL